MPIIEKIEDKNLINLYMVEMNDEIKDEKRVAK